MTESSSGEGLTVTYDDETLTFSFDWDSQTHPEYDFLLNWTSQDLTKLVTEFLDQIDTETNDQSETGLQSGGSGSGET